MKNIFLSFILFILGNLWFLVTHAQVTKVQKIKNNEIKFGGGLGTSRQFTGISVILGYNRYFGKNYVGLHYNYLEELTLWGNDIPDSKDLSLTINRNLVATDLTFAVGIGIARVWHNIQEYPERITLEQFGFPIEINAAYRFKWISKAGSIRSISIGGSAHYNENSYNPFCNFNGIVALRLF